MLTSACLGPEFASQLLVLFGLLTIGIAVPFILVQRSYRRLLAYSSIDHGGIMVLSLGFGGVLGALGMLLHMTFHSLTKPLLFFCAGNAQQHTGTDSLKKGPSGLLHELPLTAPLFLMAALAVTGTPPFSLFQSEFMVLRAGFAAAAHGGRGLICHLCCRDLLRVLLSRRSTRLGPHIRRKTLVRSTGTRQLENAPHDRSGRHRDPDRLLGTDPALHPDRARRADSGGEAMNKFDEIRANCGGLFPHWHEQPGEIYADLTAAEVRAAAGVLIEGGCRAATVFAEDRRRQEGCFIVYYVFEHPEDRRYLLLRTPDVAGTFPSIAAEIPAVNWQEREIQDWFGLEAEGHPNPRRVALHDNWPDVQPMRKDFPIDTVLPPFEGERHVYRPTLGEGVFQIPVGPIHAGIIEPGHFNFAVAGEPILYLQLRMFYVHKASKNASSTCP